MIPKFATLILLPILLTVVYLGSADDNVVGLVALGIMMVSLFCTFVTKAPVWGVLLLIISLHWFQLEGISYSIYFMLAAVSCFLIYAMRHGGLPLDRLWLILLMSQLFYVALVFAAHPYVMMKIFFFVNLTGLVFFLGAGLVKWDSWKVQQVLTAHLTFMVAWAFVERAVSYEMRIEGPSLSSTNFAVLLAVSWTIWFINGWLCKHTKMFWLVLMTMFVFVSILFSGTRMGILGMALGSLLGVLGRMFATQRQRVTSLLFRFAIAAGVLAVVAMAVWSLVPDDLFLKKGFEGLMSGKLDASSMGRIAAWYTAVTVIKSHPLWGCGPGNFLFFNAELLDKFNFIPVVQTLPRLGHAHNLFLMVLSEHGLIGFSFLGIVVVSCFWRLVNYIRKTWDGFGIALISGGIVTLFLGLFDVFPLFPSSIGWGAWYMGVLLSLRKDSQPEPREELPPEPREGGDE